MAKKNLARAVLEAGNSSVFQDARREDRLEHRREAKQYCRRALSDPSVCEEFPEPVAPERRDAHGVWGNERHDDKVGGVQRFLRTSVGRHWDEVYSEIRRRFDVRTLAGWHVVEQHIVSEFAREGTFRAEFARYLIGEDGIVREAPPPRWRMHRSRDPRPTITEAERLRWLADRKVVRRGAHLFWMIPTPVSREITMQETRRDWLHSKDVVSNVKLLIRYFRQNRRLNADEVAFFGLLTWQQQAAATDLSPIRQQAA